MLTILLIYMLFCTFTVLASTSASMDSQQHGIGTHFELLRATAHCMQLWTRGMLQNIHSRNQPIQDIFSVDGENMSSLSEEATDSERSEEDSENDFVLSPQQLQLLTTIVNPLSHSPVWGVDLYLTVLQFMVQNSII